MLCRYWSNPLQYAQRAFLINEFARVPCCVMMHLHNLKSATTTCVNPIHESPSCVLLSPAGPQELKFLPQPPNSTLESSKAAGSP